MSRSRGRPATANPTVAPADTTDVDAHPFGTVCHGCRKPFAAQATRYAIAVELAATLSPDERRLELDDTSEDPERELAELLAQLANRSAEELQDAVWQKFAFYLCAACKRELLLELRQRYQALKF